MTTRAPLTFSLVRPDGLVPFAEELRTLERDVTYPLGDGSDRFFIDHGPTYHPFFSTLGEAYFLLALRSGRPVGSVTGIVRRAGYAGDHVPSLYICDLKVHPDERGNGLARRLLRRGLRAIVTIPEARRARLLYGAAMRGARGDVMQSARGFHPFRLGAPMARLCLFFEDAARLAALDAATAPAAPTGIGLNLSPGCDEGPVVVSTAGRKDLRLVSTGEPFPLMHLARSPHGWGKSLGMYLQKAGEELVESGAPGQACFAIDERLAQELTWLGAQGLRSGAVSTVYALSLAVGLGRRAWVHLSTSEI